MANPSYTVYSFLDSVLTLMHPQLSPFIASGNVGFHQAVVSMAVDRTQHDVAADGLVMVSIVAGNPGTITIECQQTSPLHKYLLGWLNLVTAAMLNNNVQNAAAMVVFLRNTTTNFQHIAIGVSPSKFADTTYTAQGQHVTWTLHCADIENVAF